MMDEELDEYEDPPPMAEPDKSAVRMAGYLEKRGKMKMMATWKRYWFVLEGRLLLYYKSQLEYLNLSACRGSLNMGLASCVRHGAPRGPSASHGYIVEVVTRTQVVILRTKHRSLQEQWLRALLDSMTQRSISSPVKNSGRILHFRYSMDNLPILDQVETAEGDLNEKQKSLPHNGKESNQTKQDTILMRMKQIGGQSYGGSLETIIKKRQHDQPSHQPNIPRLRAVDKMLELQDREKTPSVTSEIESVLEKTSNLPMADRTAHHSSSSSVASHNTEEDQKTPEETFTIEVQIENKFYDSLAPIKEKSLSNNTEFQHSKSKNVLDSQVVMIHTPQLEEEEAIISHALVHSRKCLPKNVYCKESEIEVKESNDENQNKDIFSFNLEQDVTKKDSPPSTIASSSSHADDELCQNVKETRYNSREELSSYSENVDNKLYERLSVQSEPSIVPDVKITLNDIHDGESDEYYSSYDKVSMMQNLKIREDEFLHNTSSEPDLPPRPSAPTRERFPDSNSRNDLENAEYDYYEPGYFDPNMLPAQNLLSSGESSIKGKKGLNTCVKIKFKKKAKKSPSKESLNSESGSSFKGTKKKRKLSFLKRIMKHYRKKSSNSAAKHDESSGEEPEYETVDYSVPMLNLQQNVPSHPLLDEDETEQLGEHKEKVFGTRSILSDKTMSELRKMLRKKEAPSENLEEELEESNVTQAKESHNICIDCSRKIRNVPQVKIDQEKTEKLLVNSDNCVAVNPPSLPPRRTLRPRSPWHDIPTNNSPIYGNFEEVQKSQVQDEDEASTKSDPSSSTLADTMDQELQDELLGTSKGFFYIQKKWKDAEKSGEWNRDLRQVSFPGKRIALHKLPQQQSVDGRDALTPEEKSCAEQPEEVELCNSVNSPSIAKVDCINLTTVHLNVQNGLDNQNKGNKICLKHRHSLNTFDSAHENEDNIKTLISAQVKGDRCTHGISEQPKEPDDNNLIRFRSEKSDYDPKMSAYDVSAKIHLDRIISIKNQNKLYENKDDTQASCTNQEDKVNSIQIKGNHSWMCSQVAGQVLTNCDPNKGECKANPITNNNCDSEESIMNKPLTKDHQPLSCTNKCAGVQKDLQNKISFRDHHVKISMNTQENSMPPGNSEILKCSIEQEGIKITTNRYSDELNLLLQQLAEITSAPLLSPGVTISLVEFPESQRVQTDKSQEYKDKVMILGPIRRRRHSDPDYDVPRPHSSILQHLPPDMLQPKATDGEAIEATRFFGQPDIAVNPSRLSINCEQTLMFDSADQSCLSWNMSMAPDSLEPIPIPDEP